MGHAKHATRHEYNKPQLKEQIDAAMAAFIKAGRAVERVPTVSAAEPTVVRSTEPSAKEEES